MKVKGDLIIQNQRLGFIPQQTHVYNLSTASTTSIIPNDGTVPQITEGAELCTFTITPQRIGNYIHIIGSGFCTSTTGIMAFAIFRTGTSDALITTCSYFGTVQPWYVQYRDPVTSLSSLTYSIRYGSHNGDTAYAGFNAYYGSSGQSIATIIEYNVG